MSSYKRNVTDQYEQEQIIRRGVKLGFGNKEIAEMTGLGATQVRYRRKSMDGLPTSRVSSTKNALRRKRAPERSEWIISVGIFQAYRSGAKAETSTTYLILQAYEDYLADHSIRRDSLIQGGLPEADMPDTVHPNVFFQSCTKLVEGCLFLERCPCKKTYAAVDISDDDTDLVPRGCPCNRLTGRDETVDVICVRKPSQHEAEKDNKSVAAE